MQNRDVIQTGRSADLVTYVVFIGEERLPDTHHVKSIVIQKEINKIPYAKIVFVDGEASKRDFPLSNSELMVPGKEVRVLAGYHGNEEEVFAGVIISHKIKIRDNSSQLILECRDKAAKMTAARKSGYYYDIKDSEMIEMLIERHGLIADEVTPTNYTHRDLVQYHTADWDFMVARAQANGLVCLVDGGKLRVVKPDLAQDSLETATFGATILEFDAEMDGRHQYSKISSSSWSPADQELTEIEGNDPQVSLNGNLDPGDLAGFLGTEHLILKHGGNLSDVLLQDWADAKWLFQQLAKIRGRVRFQGISHVVPGKMISLEGVGDRFNGKTYVSGVLHQIGEGNWTVDVQFGINPEWFTEKQDIHSSPASGLYAAIQGLQIGKVTQLADDPENENRILVKIPIINDKEQGIWCRLSNLDAGNERGTFFRPEIGDEVVVGFINEDPHQAVILGMLHSSSNPSPSVATEDNHQKGYISRSGIKVLFDDETSSVVIETPAGKKVTVDDEGDTVSITDDHGNMISLDADGIKLDSSKDLTLKCSGDMILEGMNVRINAQAEFKAEGAGGAEVSTSAVAVLKGSLVQIN